MLAVEMSQIKVITHFMEDDDKKDSNIIIIAFWFEINREFNDKCEKKAKEKSRQLFVYETMTFIFFLALFLN